MLIPNNNEKGQSTIEFLMSLSLAIGISMLFVSQSMNMTVGFVVHYATFMGGRTYLSYDEGSRAEDFAPVESAARSAFQRYNLNRFDVEAEVDFQRPGEGSPSLMSGITAQYDKLLSPFKLVLDGEKAVFYSEGFLGKEPFRFTCYQSTCRSISGSNSCTSAMDITLYDNGC